MVGIHHFNIRLSKVQIPYTLWQLNKYLDHLKKNNWTCYGSPQLNFPTVFVFVFFFFFYLLNSSSSFYFWHTVNDEMFIYAGHLILSKAERCYSIQIECFPKVYQAPCSQEFEY